jgi:hypothetical protein
MRVGLIISSPLFLEMKVVLKLINISIKNKKSIIPLKTINGMVSILGGLNATLSGMVKQFQIAHIITSKSHFTLQLSVYLWRYQSSMLVVASSGTVSIFSPSSSSSSNFLIIYDKPIDSWFSFEGQF